MAKILVDNKTLELIPDFIEQVEEIGGKISVVDSFVLDVTELVFKTKSFDDNEVVLARVTRNALNGKLKITNINSTESHFRYYA
jgi:hypothetical protein